MTTLADALGPAARPLAGVVAAWRLMPAWQRRAVRFIVPPLAEQLDLLSHGVETLIGPPSSWGDDR